jgi:hypothetical protein
MLGMHPPVPSSTPSNTYCPILGSIGEQNARGAKQHAYNASMSPVGRYDGE